MLECCEFLQDVWHCPKTNGTQHILHSSSHIVDTTTRQGDSPGDFNPTEGFDDFPKSSTRQSIARWYNKSFLVSGIPKKKDSLNLRIHKAVQHWTPRQSGQLVDTHDPLSTRPLGATAPQHLRCVFSFATGRSWSVIYFTGSCYTWNTWSHSCVKHALILLSKNVLEQCWVPIGDLTQVFAMKLGNHTHFPYVPRSNFAWWNWENTHCFLALISVTGGGVTIRHDGTLRTRRWRYVPTMDVGKPAEKQGNDLGKISVSIGNPSTQRVDSPLSMVRFRGGESILPRILWDDFSMKRWLDFSHGTLWDRLRFTRGFLTWQKSHTHTSNNHLLFFVSEGVLEVEWLDTLTLHNWWICQGSWTLLDCSWTTSGCHRQVFGSFERCEWKEMSLKKSWSLEGRWQEFAKVLPTLQKTAIFFQFRVVLLFWYMCVARSWDHWLILEQWTAISAPVMCEWTLKQQDRCFVKSFVKSQQLRESSNLSK